MPPAAPHLFHPPAGGRHGARGHSGPGRACLHRVDADLPASEQRLVGRGVPAGGGGHRGPGGDAMTATLAGPEVEALTDAYRDCLVAAGMFAGHPVTSVARSFFARTGPDGW